MVHWNSGKTFAVFAASVLKVLPIIIHDAIMHATIVIGGGKGGAMGLQPHLILRCLHRILIFYHRNIFFPVK